MKKTFLRLLAVVLSLSLVLSATGLVLAEDYTETFYTQLDYSQKITPGTDMTGALSNETSPYVETQYWLGWAAGCTVTLETGKTYKLEVTSTSDDPMLHENNLIVLKGGDLYGKDGNFFGDALTPSVGESVSDATTQTVSTVFTANAGGDYRVLLINYFSDNNGDTEETISYTLTVEEISIDRDVVLEINNKDDLLAFAAQALADASVYEDKAVSLKANIDMTGEDWEPLGLYNMDFLGNGNTLTGLNAPFISTAEQVMIKDLHLVGSTLELDADDGNISDVGGLICEANSVRLSGCSVSGSITLAGQDIEDVGGLIGSIDDDSWLYNCSAQMEISLTAADDLDDIGGLIGEMDGNNRLINCTASGSILLQSSEDGDADIEDIGGLAGYTCNYNYYENCTAAVDISAAGYYTTYIGGLLGYVSGNSALVDCRAEGGLDLAATDYSYYIGGLVGYMDDDNLLQNCTASGNITATGEDYIHEIGGLVGYMDDDNLLKNCSVSVNITATGTGDVYEIGGLVGYMDDDNLLQNCATDGNVTAAHASLETGYYYVASIGGFVGNMDCNNILENCSAAGEVSLTITSDIESENEFYGIGGFAGDIEDYNTLRGCWATGDVTVTTPVTVYAIGGFAGQIDEYNRFINCSADGNVKADNGEEVGGFLGESWCCGYNLFLNCYSIGDVAGLEKVGGFAGVCHNDETFVNVYSAGAVSGEECVGALIGFIDSSKLDTVSFDNIYCSNPDNLAVVWSWDSIEEEGTGLLADDVEGITCWTFSADNLAALTKLLNDNLEAGDDFEEEFAQWGSKNAKNGPVFRTVTITFLDENGATLLVLSDIFINSDVTGLAPAIPVKEGYTGAWDQPLNNVTANMTVQAVYTQNPPTVQGIGILLPLAGMGLAALGVTGTAATLWVRKKRSND